MVDRARYIAAAVMLVLVSTLVSARPSTAWPLRVGLELQAGTVLAGSDLGIGSTSLTDGAGTEWTGRFTLTLSPRLPGGVEWQTGLAYQQWTIRDDVTFTFIPSGGPFGIETLTFDLTQTVQELTVPLHARFARAAGSGWFLDLGADVSVRLAVRQSTDSEEPAVYPFLAHARSRVTDPLAARADIFEDVGTFGSTTDIADRFVPVAVGATAGVGYRWGRSRPAHVSLTLQQGLHDQEAASIAVVRPTRIVLGLGIGL